MTEKNPLVSIITPVYKVEKYLDRCVESVIAQTYKNWELFLVDDGSPDNSGYLCDNWSERDKRVHTVHKSNGGVSSARNWGLEEVHGEFVMFLDSDDWYDPECVEKCVLNVVTNDVDVLQFNFFDSKENGAITLPRQTNCGVCSIENYVNQRCVGVCVWQGIYRRDLIENNHIRFDTRMKYAEDGVFVCSALYHSKKMMRLKEPLYYYYKNSNSAMHKKDFYPYIESMILQIEFLDQHPVFQPMYKNLVTMNVGGICTLDLNRHKRKRLKEIWLKYKDNSPYVHIDEYHESRSIEKVFLPLQRVNFTLAWFFTALATKMYWSLKKD